MRDWPGDLVPQKNIQKDGIVCRYVGALVLASEVSLFGVPKHLWA